MSPLHPRLPAAEVQVGYEGPRLVSGMPSSAEHRQTGAVSWHLGRHGGNMSVGEAGCCASRTGAKS